MTKENKEIYIYPIIINFDDQEKSEQKYFIEIPDFNGFTQASSIEEGVQMAREYIGNALIELDELNQEFPTFDLNKIHKISNTSDGFVTSVDIDFKKFKAASDNRVVKKTLTIPNYLNVLALDNNINFSELLTNSLKHELGV